VGKTDNDYCNQSLFLLGLVMIQQINNNSIRDTEMHESDIDFLRKFYVEHSHFPVFQQVLIETRTDCNNHCPFCPHAFNKKTLGIMKWKCYTTIIDQLCEISHIVGL
jgi:hypothetical protein